MAKILLTTLQTAAGFGVSDMTIYSWRAGSAKYAQLPVVKGPKGEAPSAVRFDADAMEKYAKKHGRTFDLLAAQSYVKPDRADAKPVAKKEAPAKKATKKEPAPTGRVPKLPSAKKTDAKMAARVKKPNKAASAPAAA